MEIIIEIAVYCIGILALFKVLFLFSEYVTTKVVGVTCKMFKCLTCEKMFGDIWKIKKHLITHTKDRPWSCDLCGKGYTTKHILKTHKCHAMGIGPRTDPTELDKLYPYWCSYCSRGFSRPSDCDEHGSTRTRAHPLICCVCERPLSLKRTTSKHCQTGMETGTYHDAH